MIVKCTVAYDGWAYAGWQKQENALGIQEIIESALEKIHKKFMVQTVAYVRVDAVYYTCIERRGGGRWTSILFS